MKLTPPHPTPPHPSSLSPRLPPRPPSATHPSPLSATALPYRVSSRPGPAAHRSRPRAVASTPLPRPFSRPVSLFPAEVACRPPTVQTRSGAVPGSVSAPGLTASVPCCCAALPRRPPSGVARVLCGFASALWAQGQAGAGVGLKASRSYCALAEGRSGRRRRRERRWTGVCD